MKPAGPFSGVLFDMDGVLVDSEDVTAEAAAHALAEFGAVCDPEEFRPYRGGDPDRYFGAVAEAHGVPYDPRMKERTYDLYGSIIASRDIACPGVRELVRTLKARGYRLAVCSSSDPRKLRLSLGALGPAAECFSAALSGQDFVQNKPAPDVYLAGARALGLAASDCLVAEDALNGIRAGKAAGCTVAAVPTSFPKDALREAGADFLLDSIGGLADLLK